jgi:hypothetical protein
MNDKTEQIEKREKETPTKETMIEGGTFTLTPHDLENLSAEFTEINNIFALAKADDGVKALLFNEFRREFGDEFLCFVGEQQILTEKRIDELITAVEENIEIEQKCRNENCEAIAYLPDHKRQELKTWVMGK